MYKPVSPAVSRQQIIDVFLFRAPAAQRYELRQQLEALSNAELETAHAALQAQAQLQAQEEKLLEIQIEADVEQGLHRDRMFKSYESQDRKIFGQAARSFRFGENEANFQLIRSVIGPHFTEYRIQEAIDSNAVALSPPTESEIASWNREQVASAQDSDQKGRIELLALIEGRINQSEYRHTIRQYIQTSSTYQQLRDRVQLCGEIADNHSPDQRVNNQEFCLLLLANKDTETYRERVTNIREVQKFKTMSPLELKTYLAKKRTEQQPSHEERVAAEIIAPEDQRLLEAANNDPRPALPERTSHGEEIDAAYLNKIQATDYSTYRELLQRHGRVRLEARIRAVK